MRYSVVSLPARKTTLDRYFADEGKNLFAVCDGVSAGGEFSVLFVDRLIQRIQENASLLPYSLKDTETFLTDFVQTADRDLPAELSDYYGGQINPHAIGAGSTLAMVYFTDSHCMTVNSGDSKVLLVRDGELIQLSYDDTQFNKWIEYGLVTIVDDKIQYEDRGDYAKYAGIEVPKREVLRSMRRMVRWIGNDAKPHLMVEPTLYGDIVILLTDGAESILDRYMKPSEIAQAVVSVANGKYEHLLAACPRFWEGYSARPGYLFDDATAMVLYS